MRLGQSEAIGTYANIFIRAVDVRCFSGSFVNCFLEMLSLLNGMPFQLVKPIYYEFYESTMSTML